LPQGKIIPDEITLLSSQVKTSITKGESNYGKWTGTHVCFFAILYSVIDSAADWQKISHPALTTSPARVLHHMSKGCGEAFRSGLVLTHDLPE
jgi:hypothetical protein